MNLSFLGMGPRHLYFQNSLSDSTVQLELWLAALESKLTNHWLHFPTFKPLWEWKILIPIWRAASEDRPCPCSLLGIRIYLEIDWQTRRLRHPFIAWLCNLRAVNQKLGEMNKLHSDPFTPFNCVTLIVSLLMTRKLTCITDGTINLQQLFLLLNN